jgi:hypothetical protein
MRFYEFKHPIFEFEQMQQPGTGSSDPAQDLEYLITNTDLTPELKKLIGKSVRRIVQNQSEQPNIVKPQSPAQIQPPAKQIQKQPAVTPKPEIGEPMGQSPEDELALREDAVGNEEAELLNYIKSVKNKAELGKLLYVVRDGQFKKMASDIVYKKIKFKPRETYELVKTKIRALSTRIPVSVMTDFLNDCLESGIVNTVGMITGDTEDSTIPLTDPKYQKIAEAFLDLNLERLGKGEIGLAFMGIDAIKESSDISISGVPIEVKASKGTDFFMKGNPDEGGFGHQTEAVKILVKALNSVGADFKPTNRSKQGGIASLGKTNTPLLNQYFKLLGRPKTIEVLISVLKELNKKAPKIVDRYSEEIASAVLEDGTVDYSALGIVTAKINYEYYQAMSHHEGLLVLNLQSFQYVYVTDADVFAELVGSNVLQQMYAIDFRSNGLGGIAYIMNAIQ